MIGLFTILDIPRCPISRYYTSTQVSNQEWQYSRTTLAVITYSPTMHTVDHRIPWSPNMDYTPLFERTKWTSARESSVKASRISDGVP